MTKEEITKLSELSYKLVCDAEVLNKEIINFHKLLQHDHYTICLFEAMWYIRDIQDQVSWIQKRMYACYDIIDP